MHELSPAPEEIGPLPAHLKPLFWDYEFSHLSWTTDQDLIVARILAYGDWQALRWLLDQMGRDALRSWIGDRHGRGLDARRLRFWELVLDLPHREVTTWIRDQARDSWPRRNG